MLHILIIKNVENFSLIIVINYSIMSTIPLINFLYQVDN